MIKQTTPSERPNKQRREAKRTAAKFKIPQPAELEFKQSPRKVDQSRLLEKILDFIEYPLVVSALAAEAFLKLAQKRLLLLVQFFRRLDVYLYDQIAVFLGADIRRALAVDREALFVLGAYFELQLRLARGVGTSMLSPKIA